MRGTLHQTMPSGQVILFIPEGVSGQKVSMIAALLKVRCRLVSTEAFTRTLASVLGLSDAEETWKAEERHEMGEAVKTQAEEARTEQPEDNQARGSGQETEPMLVFCGLQNTVLDRFLAELRKNGIRIPLKAVMTETNRDWTLRKLYDELRGEHSYMTGEKL